MEKYGPTLSPPTAGENENQQEEGAAATAAVATVTTGGGDTEVGVKLEVGEEPGNTVYSFT